MATNVVTLSLQLLLPVFSQFADRADLGVPLPLTEKRVTEQFVGKRARSFMATFDGRYQFNWFSRGKGSAGLVHYYDRELDSPHVKPSKLLELAKQVSLITSNDAKAIAEDCVRRLGYDITKIRARPPLVGQRHFQHPQTGKSMPLPLFGAKWFLKGDEEPHWSELLLEIQVSAITKKVVYFSPSPRFAKAGVEDYNLSQGSGSKDKK